MWIICEYVRLNPFQLIQIVIQSRMNFARANGRFRYFRKFSLRTGFLDKLRTCLLQLLENGFSAPNFVRNSAKSWFHVIIHNKRSNLFCIQYPFEYCRLPAFWNYICNEFVELNWNCREKIEFEQLPQYQNSARMLNIILILNLFKRLLICPHARMEHSKIIIIIDK